LVVMDFMDAFFIIYFLAHFSLGLTPLICNTKLSLPLRSVVIHVVEPTVHGFPS